MLRACLFKRNRNRISVQNMKASRINGNEEARCQFAKATKESEEKNTKKEDLISDTESTTESTTDVKESELNEEKKETEVKNAAEPTPAGSSPQCSSCTDYLVWDEFTQEHVDVKLEALFARAFLTRSDEDTSTQVESKTNQEPVSLEDQQQSKQATSDFIVPDKNGEVFKGKRPLRGYGCANMTWLKHYKGESRESAKSMPNTVYSGPDIEPSCTKYTSNISEPTHSDFDSDSDEDTAGSSETVASQGKPTVSLSEAVITHNEPVYNKTDNDTIPNNEDDNRFKDVVFRLGVRDANGHDIIVVDASRLPVNKNLSDKKEADEVSRSLTSYIEVFIHSFVDTHNFVVLVHPGNNTRTRMVNAKIGKSIYKMLKNCFSDRLARCVIYKPEFKLRAYVNLVRPFLKREMRSKILFSKSQRNLEQGFGFPIPVIHCL
ncbi:uncharacterized protein LOC144634869 isoform X2 [Oculina patagonica]